LPGILHLGEGLGKGIRRSFRRALAVSQRQDNIAEALPRPANRLELVHDIRHQPDEMVAVRRRCASKPTLPGTVVIRPIAAGAIEMRTLHAQLAATR
jgi:hypothetical protein